MDKLAEYWEYIEKKFDCAGWCQSTYTHNSDLTGNVEKEGMIMKYLFSGINRGIVKHSGCLTSMIDWIRPRLIIIGLVEFFAAIVMVLTFILGICLIKRNKKENSNDNKKKEKKSNEDTDEKQEIKGDKVDVERKDNKSE